MDMNPTAKPTVKDATMDKPSSSTLDKCVAMVVEDEPFVRACAAEALTNAGCRVFEAKDAHDALVILGERPDIEIVMTDIEMPGELDGLALAATIRARWPEIVILVNSGRVRPDTDTLPAGAGFIAKPYHVGELIGQLEALIGKRRDTLRKSDDDILVAWHAAELDLKCARAAAKGAAISRAVMAEQAAIERFGVGGHTAAYDARFPGDRPR